MELKQSTSQMNLSVGCMSQMVGQAKPQAATTASQSTHVAPSSQAEPALTTLQSKTYIRGLPNSILQKIFAQVTLPNGLAAWKTVIRNLDCLH